MKNLKNKSLLLSLFFLMSACQSTTAFNLKTLHEKDSASEDRLHIIRVNSNRVQQKCLFLNAETENNWRHQYLMYILNDKNEVLEIMQPTNQDKDSCSSQAARIDKILKVDPQVRVCVRDELKKNVQNTAAGKELVQFGLLGSHKIAYEALTLDSICNSKKCFSNNDIWTNACPGFEKK